MFTATRPGRRAKFTATRDTPLVPRNTSPPRIPSRAPRHRLAAAFVSRRSTSKFRYDETLNAFTLYPGVVIACRPIGMLQVEQTNKVTRARERNDRLVVLPVDAPRCAPITTVEALGERTRQELELFFKASVELEGKEVALLGWRGPADALELVQASSGRNT